MKKKYFKRIIIIVLILGNVFFYAKYWGAKREVASLRVLSQTSNVNDKILNFTDAFIKNILESKGEVGFDTRLALENQVRAINDPEILARWQAFTDSKNEAIAQDNVKKLLEVLISKVRQ